jgi:hypothetical protein
LEAYWKNPGAEDWASQTLFVTPPWGGEPIHSKISENIHTYALKLERPPADESRPATGAYFFSVERPYNPANFGTRGYDSDLGILLRRVAIQKVEAFP